MTHSSQIGKGNDSILSDDVVTLWSESISLAAGGLEGNLVYFGVLGWKSAVLNLVSRLLLPEDSGAKVAEMLCRIGGCAQGEFAEDAASSESLECSRPTRCR